MRPSRSIGRASAPTMIPCCEQPARGCAVSRNARSPGWNDERLTQRRQWPRILLPHRNGAIMPLDRRRFLLSTGMSMAGAALARPARGASPQDWAWVRDQFELRRDLLHFATFYLVSHPRPAREAIEALRRGLDENPFEVVEHGLFIRPDEIRRAVAAYLGGRPEDVALTRSTT